MSLNYGSDIFPRVQNENEPEKRKIDAPIEKIFPFQSEKVEDKRKIDAPVEKIFPPSFEKEKDEKIKPIERIFAPRGELLANFDYADISEGIGYNVYYGSKGDNGEYLLSPNISYSEEVKTFISPQLVALTATKYFDLDFDLTFNLPKNLFGKIIANIPMGVKATATSQNDVEFYCIVKAIHYDGSTETILATGTSITTQATGIETDSKPASARMLQVKMDVTTIKHFKKGETLRFTVEGWFKSLEVSAKNTDIAIGHDPQNREDTQWGNVQNQTVILSIDSSTTAHNYIPTRMEFQVPFRIEV